MIAILLAVTALAQTAPRALPTPTPDANRIGQETVITFAGNGGLRGWQKGPDGSGILYVRDRREQWYRVTLTGPCLLDRELDTLSYTTDTNGTFDRFSSLRVATFSNQLCGIQSIQTSLAPPGYPEVRPRKR